ncbi:MAG: RluA family pseudouridine synthase [Ruminococcus sp.]|nr:RluA family pseudouridine synthase [Ruminococcus sp.]
MILKELKLTVNSKHPLTLQKFLTEKNVSRRLLTRLKREHNGITRNGVTIRTIDTVYDGDVISLKINDSKFLTPNPALCIPVAFENENLVIFDKSAGIPVHPSIKHQGDTVGNCFASLYPELTFRPVNRLDKDTSGLVLIAKNTFSANILQKSCTKTYYAIVHGITDISGTINTPIAREQESIITRCVREDGQQAVTHYRRIAYNDKYSLLEIHLETGRTHQIRVHFSHIGHALAGDDLYGGMRTDIQRQALHCGEMSFRNPVTDETITIKSDIPDDMKNLMNGAL